MRLTPAQRQYILQTTHQNFGADANVWLFDLRIDDMKHDGNVDLMVKERGKDKPIYQIAKKQGIQL